MRKYNKLFYFFAIIFLLKNSVVFAYRIPEYEVREMETFDNEVCLSRGHSTEDEYSIRLYWSCRLSLIDERIEESLNFTGRYKKGWNKFYTKELKRMKTLINNVIEKIESDFETRIESIYENNKEYERKLVLRGADKYYYNLLSFLSLDYYPIAINSKREINEIINFRNKQQNVEVKTILEEQLRKFPFCIKYDRDSNEFNECLRENRKVELCKEMTEERLRDNEMQIKFNCKKKAAEMYPDYMALYNSEFEELKNLKADSYNFDRNEKRRVEDRMKELNKLMSGPRLSKNQLIDIRKYEERKCLLDSQLEKNLFKIIVSDECEKLLKNIRGKE
jgi:hypothetical protein